MKTHKVLFLALLVSALLAVSVEAVERYRNSGRSRSSVQSFSSGSRFHYGGNRTIGSSPRFSSMGVRSMPSSPQWRGQRSTTFNPGGNVASFSQRRFTPGTFNRSNTVTRFQNNRNFGTAQGNRINRFGNNNRGFNRIGSGNHVFARRSADWHRDWDRHRDHFWNGHRCRFVNGSWFIFDFGFVPWYGRSYYDYYPYDYYYPYSYGGYGYGYDPGVYDQSAGYDQGGYNYNPQPNYDDQSNDYDQGDSKSYNQHGNGVGSNERATVADVQDQLARAGYYRGKVDGVLGPETRHALVRYQSAKGLRVTGSLTTETQQSLGLAAQGGDQVTDQ